MILIIPVVSHSIEMGSSSFSAAEVTHPTGATVVWDDSNTKLILRTDHKWGLVLWYAMSLSTIFQLYRGDGPQVSASVIQNVHQPMNQ
jgi:hypothetical protein